MTDELEGAHEEAVKGMYQALRRELGLTVTPPKGSKRGEGGGGGAEPRAAEAQCVPGCDGAGSSGGSAWGAAGAGGVAGGPLRPAGL